MMEAGRKRLISVLVIMLAYMIVLLFALSYCTDIAPAEEVPEEPTVIQEIPEKIVEAPVEIVKEKEPPVVDQPEPPIEEEVVEQPQEVVPEVEPTVLLVEEPEPIEEPEIFWETEETWVPDESWITEKPAEDPWADFYVAGEEDYSIFEDGTYYVPLIVNGEYLTDINVTFLQSKLLIEVGEFRTIISNLLVESFKQELFTTTERYFSLEFLNEKGIETYYDYQTFELYMNFTTWMMPTRVLSINRGSLTRYSSYSMSGSMFIEPQPFSWFANVSVYSQLEVAAANAWQINPTSLFTMQSRNSFSLYDLGFDFSYTVHPGRAYNKTNIDPWSDDFSDYISFQGIQGFYDFKPKSLRFIFGNVNDFLGYSTDSFGIAVEKRYNYGDAKPKNHQYEYEVVVEEPSIVEVLINEKSVYRRELQAGIYKLRDFVFTQGANFARVTVEPLADPSAKEEYEFVIGYDSRLLSRGDSLYSASLSFPGYDIERTTFRINQQLGVSDDITSSYSLGFSPAGLTLGLSNLFATRFGSFDVTVASSFNAPLLFGFSSTLGYRLSGKEDSPFGTFSFSAGFTSNRYSSSVNVSPTAVPASAHTIDANLSYSGRVGEKLRYTIGGSLNWVTDDSRPYWRVTMSTGMPLIPRMSFTGSLSISASPSVPTAQVRGQIGLNYSFTPNLSASASSNLQDSTYVSASWRPFGSTNNNMQFSFSGIPFDDPLDHQGSISYSRTGNIYGLSLRQQYSDRFSRFSTSLSLNTAFAYADGLLGMTRSVSDTFLLVRPGGSLKGSDIAVTRTMTSEPTALPSLFGVGTYTGITTHEQNNVVIYGIGDTLMGSSESFIYNFMPRPRQGYAIRISSEATYSLVGHLLRSPTAAYSRYTTDLAHVTVDEQGQEILMLDDTLYLFTDENGFFFISGVKAGEYQFSIFLPASGEDEPPIDVRFIVEENEDMDSPLVLVLENFVASEISEALEMEAFAEIMGNEVDNPILDEDGYYRLDIVDSMDEIAFWDNYYPSRQVLDSFSGQVATSDSFVEFIAIEEEMQPSALSRMRKEQELRLFNLSRLREIVKPYLDAIAPQDGWKPEIR